MHMEKILGVSREEVRPEELRFFCAFWTELGYEVLTGRQVCDAASE